MQNIGIIDVDLNLSKRGCVAAILRFKKHWRHIMRNLWAEVYKMLDEVEHTIIGGEFLPSETNQFGQEYVTTIRIHILFGVGSVGIIDSNHT